VVVLRDLEELSSGAAGAALGLSSDAVRQRLRRAHRMLRRHLEQARPAASP
jgi:DNA-directed RNA polymerase specialized sigma24 family protein